MERALSRASGRRALQLSLAGACVLTPLTAFAQTAPAENPSEPSLSAEVWVNNLGDPTVGSTQAGLSLQASAPAINLQSGRVWVEGAANGRGREANAEVVFDVAPRAQLFAFGGASEIKFPIEATTIRSEAQTFGGGLVFHLPSSATRGADLIGRVLVREAEARSETAELLDERVAAAQGSYRVRWRVPGRSGKATISALTSIPSATEVRLDRRIRAGLEPASEDFGTVSGRYEEAFRLTDRAELFASINGQYGWETIPFTFKFAYGGAGDGGAFHPDTLVGDHGASAAVELRRAFVAGPVTKGRVYLRADGAWVKSRAAPFAPREDRAAAWAIGVRGEAGRYFVMQLEYGRPLVEPRFARTPNDRLLFEVSTRLPFN